MAEPLVDLGERLGTQAVDPKLRLLADLDQARLTQHPQVPGDSRAGDRQQLGQLTHRGGAVLSTSSTVRRLRPTAPAAQRP